MKKYITLLILSLMLIHCGRSSETTKQKKLQEKVVPVIVEKVQERDLQQFIYITGKLEGIVDITMSSETNGKIIELYKKLGDPIEKGETIGRIDNQELLIQLEQANANLLAAEASFDMAEINWKTAENLYKINSISELEYVQAKSNYKNALSGLQAAKANLKRNQKSVDNSNLVSPVTGVIADLHLEIGEYLSMGQPIATIINKNELIIKTGIGETSIHAIKNGQQVYLQTEFSEDEYIGIISGIGLKPIQGTANYPIEIHIKNPDQLLLPGMVVQGKIVSKVYKNAMYTNLNNIASQYDDRFVFIIDENNIAKKTFVKLGAEIADNVLITEGLQLADQLVIEGIANLEDGTKVEIRMINE